MQKRPLSSFGSLLATALAPMAVTFAIAAAPAPAQAQRALLTRCEMDNLDPALAEARLQWARRCALTSFVVHPEMWFDTGVPASNGGTLKDYAEYDISANPLGWNSYIGQLHYFEANSATTLSLYAPSPTTTQSLDGDGFYRWERPANRKRAQPLYPIFGSQPDIYSPTNIPLYPRYWSPQDCNLYTEGGIITALSGPAENFYINAYCGSSTAALAADDGETKAQTEELRFMNRALHYKTIPAELIP